MAATKIDYYAVLGLTPSATDAEIKLAYRSLAKKWHPDANGNSPESHQKMAELSEAYGILGNSASRKEYDYSCNYGGSFTPHFSWDDSILSGMDFTGDRVRPKHPDPVDGSDISVSVDVTFKEAYFGCDKKIKLQRKIRCKECNGTGRGSLMDCENCKGTGVVTIPVTTSIKVPAGTCETKSVRLRGKGNEGLYGGKDGDLVLTLNVEKDDVFSVKDGNMHCTIHINFGVACLGGDVVVSTMNKDITLHIPEGTQTGDVLKVRNKGLPMPNGTSFGDLFVTVIVDVPKSLTLEQRQALSRIKSVMLW